MNLSISECEQEKAFYQSDPSYDGIFYTGVKTTGIFCLPSCKARKPLRENIVFFSTVQKAMFAGYRACKKCTPLQIGKHAVEWLPPLLQEIDENPHARIRDSFLSEYKVHPATVRRYFQKYYGMTFQAYCRAKRMAKAFELIQKGAKADDVAFDQGYESLSGFRDTFFKQFGTTPARSKKSELVYVSWVESPLGPLVAGATQEGVCLLEFTDRRRLELQIQNIKKYFGPPVPGKNEHLELLEKELKAYFTGELKFFRTKLMIRGTDFQTRVWEQLLHIPYGKTISYQELAGILGKSGASRAVGTANGMNRVSILIPCHRVVNKNGELGGYGGGLWRKRHLLDLELRSATSKS